MAKKARRATAPRDSIILNPSAVPFAEDRVYNLTYFQRIKGSVTSGSIASDTIFGLRLCNPYDIDINNNLGNAQPYGWDQITASGTYKSYTVTDVSYKIKVTNLNIPGGKDTILGGPKYSYGGVLELLVPLPSTDSTLVDTQSEAILKPGTARYQMFDYGQTVSFSRSVNVMKLLKKEGYTDPPVSLTTGSPTDGNLYQYFYVSDGSFPIYPASETITWFLDVEVVQTVKMTNANLIAS